MKEVKLTIPNKWEDITISVYQKYIKVQGSKIDERKKIINSIALLCNTTETIVKQMNFKDLKDIVKIIKELVDTEPNKMMFKKRFKFDNEDYGFIPNLSKLTTGEYIDLENYCKEPIENLHVIMSILYRKITFKRGERYAIEDYDPDQFKEELFKSCPMDIALSSLGFFFDFRRKISKDFSQLFEKTEQENTDKKGSVNMESKWGWYNILYGLSNSILDIEKIVKKPILEVLTYLAFTQDHNNTNNNNYDKLQ